MARERFELSTKGLCVPWSGAHKPRKLLLPDDQVDVSMLHAVEPRRRPAVHLRADYESTLNARSIPASTGNLRPAGPTVDAFQMPKRPLTDLLPARQNTP